MKIKYQLLFYYLIFSIITSSIVLAEEKSDLAKSTTAKEYIKIGEVMVRGEAVCKNLDATSATVLTSEDITNRVFITPLDIVSLSPGISIRQYKQGGTAASFTMRGFRSCSHGSDVAIYMDGIPLNEGDGYADTNIVNPEEIERVELTKGPVSALYGNYNSAGALAFYTKKKVDFSRIKLHYGDYNTYEANYVGGFSSEDKKWDHVYSILSYHTDGYQDNSDWDKLNAAVRSTYHFTDALDGTVSFRGFNSDWDAPGYLTEVKFNSNPKQAVSEVNGGGKDRTSAKLDLNYKISDKSNVLFQLWTYDQEFWRWYANDPDGKIVGSISGNLRNFNRFVWGTGASYNFSGKIMGKELRFTAGMDYMDEDIERERWRLLFGSGREKGSKFWDYHVDMESIGFYTETNYQVFKPLRLIFGARYDLFSGDLTDHQLDDQKESMEDQNIFSPKAGLILSFFDEKLNFFANYSKGFALLPGFSEKAAFTQDHWDPQERIQYEVGVKTSPFNWFSGKLVGFKVETDKDFIQDQTTDEYENVGKTTREGIEVAIDFYAFDYGYLHADYAFIDATYDEYLSKGISYDGKTLRNVPDNIAGLEFGYNPVKGFGGRIQYHYESGYYLDDANIYKSDSWDTVDIQTFYCFGIEKKYMLALDVINIFDKKYADYTGGGTEKKYSPGLPLSVYTTFTITF